MQWETVIGLEVHAQLSTRTKIFSGASTAFGAAANTQACAVDIALPGVLPVLNRGAVERAIRFGLAIGARLNRSNVFDRKNYFYPDLPKGYQISQLTLPIVEAGELKIQVPSTSSGQATSAGSGQPEEKTVRITRAHLEEDAGKSLHEDFHGMTGIDLNRAGTPLLEIVSEPDMRSAKEAVAYAKALHTLVTWIGICDGNMQEGSFRVDANVSVRPMGQQEYGTRREIKNLNSFRFLEQAINYEVRWQIEQIEDGHSIQQATVLFDPDSGETRVMRTKEDAHDYRYFPDPDLLPVKLDEDWIEQVRASLPELPKDMQARYKAEFGLSAYDAETLTAKREMAVFFERMVATIGKEFAKPCANWIMGELTAYLNKDGMEIGNCLIPPEPLAALIKLLADGHINSKGAKEVFAMMWDAGKQRVPGTFTVSGPGWPNTIVMQLGLQQITDTSAMESIIDEVLAANAKSVEEFHSGKEKAFNALVGQVMKASRGKANPAQVNELLRTRLAS